MAIGTCGESCAMMDWILAVVVTRKKEFRGRWAGLVAPVACLVVSLLLPPGSGAMGKVRWFQVGLGQGEISGYRWAVGIKGPKHRPLGRVCAELSLAEPAKDDAPDFEGGSSTLCGRLEQPSDSVTGVESLGSGNAQVTLLEALYRPIIRKVTFVLATGERRIFLPRVPKLSNRSARGIPAFRYFAATFEGQTCVRRVVTFDGRGRVVSNELSPLCHGHSGNL